MTSNYFLTFLNEFYPLNELAVVKGRNSCSCYTGLKPNSSQWLQSGHNLPSIYRQLRWSSRCEHGPVPSQGFGALCAWAPCIDSTKHLCFSYHLNLHSPRPSVLVLLNSYIHSSAQLLEYQSHCSLFNLFPLCSLRSVVIFSIRSMS